MSGYPHESPIPSFWLSDAGPLANHRTSPDLPSEADVVIIGSGYSGAATAYYLLQDEGARPSTVILEARQTCSGATGRNGGHLKPDVFLSWANLESMFGAETAAELVNFEMKQVMDVKKLVEKEEIDCDFQITRAIDVFVDEIVLKPTADAYWKMVKGGVNNTSDLQYSGDPKVAEQISGVKGALGAFSYTAGHLWPSKMITHLLHRAIEWGANLQTNTPATSISSTSDASGRWTVSTPRGTILAKDVVVAANAYTPALLSEFADKITAVRGVCTRIAVPEGTRAPHLNNTYCIRFGPNEYDYLIPGTDGSIIVGGAKQAVLRDKHQWYNNSNDSELIEGAEEYFEGYMQRLFHGWEDSGAKTTHIWTGIMGYSSDMMPYVGQLPEKKGIWVSAAFTGHGMPRILGCSRAIAGMMKGKISSPSESDVPGPYWINEKRMESWDSVVLRYMAGKRD